MAEWFRQRYHSAMLSIQEYAERAGISSQAVRKRILTGRLPARKVGREWVIADDVDTPRPQRPGRKLSTATFDELAAYLDGDTAGLHPDRLRRARERASLITRLGLPQIAEYARRPDLHVRRFRAGDADVAELRIDPRLALTGISHPDAEVYGASVDAYVSSATLDDIELFHMLDPASRREANVVLRAQDPPPRTRRLHIIADLLDDHRARSTAEAERLLDQLIEERGR
ncbi:helix-turn-helix domain-containing protein [Brachybacterium tyrofermentans]|uniref:Helix-turn-helix domain-containing protein n=2 Tax=Brachybacterium tyrofermentans TaxID=47848 RepID=A0ABW0FDX8_9MICO